MRYLYIKTDGSVEEVKNFKGGNKFSLEELQSYVDGLIEIVPLKHGNELIVNEEGKCDGLKPNYYATKLWEESYGQTDVIVGNVLFKEVRPVSSVAFTIEPRAGFVEAY